MYILSNVFEDAWVCADGTGSHAEAPTESTAPDFLGTENKIRKVNPESSLWVPNCWGS